MKSMAPRSAADRPHGLPEMADQDAAPLEWAAARVGDRWTLLILRDLLIQHKTMFREFQSSDEAIASNVLAERLRRLEACGLITRTPSPVDGRVMLYAPTDAARDLIPVLVEMSHWGATHDAASGAPAEFKAAYRADRAGLITAIRSGTDPSRPN